MDIVINVEPGGFGLSRKAMLALAKLGHSLAREDLAKMEHMVKDTNLRWLNGQDLNGLAYGRDIERNDPLLIKIVRELGPEANAPLATLKIVSIPDDVAWQIGSNDAGCEWVAEEHRIWD